MKSKLTAPVHAAPLFAVPTRLIPPMAVRVSKAVAAVVGGTFSLDGSGRLRKEEDGNCRDETHHDR